MAEQVSKRDSQVFAELYTRYVDRIYKYVYFKSGGRDEAEDLTAQIFLKAWETVNRYRWKGYPFSSWLFRIAHNQVIDYYRTRHDNYSLEDIRSRKSEDDPFEAALVSFTSSEIRSALLHLTLEQSRVLVLRFLDGYSTKEVASIMHKDADSIRALQYRALRAIEPWLVQERPQSRHKIKNLVLDA